MIKDIKEDIKVFESGSILFYLAQKFNKFLSTDLKDKTQTLNWLFWQMGSTPYLGGGFGHFYSYAPYKIKYCIDRFAMETKRQLDVLDKHLANNEYMAGNEYTIADIATWPWYGTLCLNRLYNAAEFLQVQDYKNLQKWTKQIDNRAAVKRGRLVNRVWGPEDQQLKERHHKNDFKNLNL